MNASSWRQMIHRVDRWRAPRAAAAGWACLGGILGLITIILSALSAVSPQQAIALALPATIITIGGLVRSVVPDSYTAWRRGFKQGCHVAVTRQRDALYSGSLYSGAVAPGRSAPLSQHGLPPAAL
jgi:choline-glycine betaine transporter